MYEQIHFPGQAKEEVVILLLRRHWFVLFMRLLSIIAAIFVLIGVYLFYSSLNSNFQESAYYNLLLFGESLGILFVWNFFFVLWVDYYLDAWIVTNERIINIEQRGFFNRDISELKLTKIQDVTSEIHGVIPTLFNYGNICVQTAGSIERFIFQQIPDPNRVKNLIIQLQKNADLQQDRTLGEAVRGEL
jgi:uncharacterized membrane protein YdbT with pleckstrin-like domain